MTGHFVTPALSSAGSVCPDRGRSIVGNIDDLLGGTHIKNKIELKDCYPTGKFVIQRQKRII